MEFVRVTTREGIASVVLSRGKVNAINEKVVEELTRCFRQLADDAAVKAVIITGSGRFFTFGFDIPEFMGYPKADFIRYLTKFTDLYTYLFMYRKPVIAALNGHTIAGGCMLSLACDCRIMVSGKSKISLNEINFGSSVFAGSVEMLKFWIGARQAAEFLCSGEMYSAEEAHRLGLVNQVVSETDLDGEAMKMAKLYAGKDGAAFASIKGLLRRFVAEEMVRREKASILEFVDIWYSENTWKNLQSKVIHS